MLFQFLPRLSDEEYAALEASIREHGVQVPILVDEHQSVIDGHHRKEIADRLGVDCPRRSVADVDEATKRTLALSLNLDRRHLDRRQRRDLVERSLRADPQLSDRQHAARTGVDHKTVATRREDLERRGEIPHVSERTDTAGRTQPATRATPQTPQGEAPGLTSTREPDPASPTAEARPAAKPATETADQPSCRPDPQPAPERGRGPVPSSSPDPGRPTQPSAATLVAAVKRAVDNLAAAGGDALDQLEVRHRREARAAHEQFAAVLDRIDPQTDPDLDAAAADIAARAHVDVDEARWIARAVRDRNKPSNLAGYVGRIDPADLLARYRPDRKQSAAAMPPCEHGVSGGLRIIGRGADASRHCLRCEQADPAVSEERQP